jgi:hypothetical protein
MAWGCATLALGLWGNDHCLSRATGEKATYPAARSCPEKGPTSTYGSPPLCAASWPIPACLTSNYYFTTLKLQASPTSTHQRRRLAHLSSGCSATGARILMVVMMVTVKLSSMQMGEQAAQEKHGRVMLLHCSFLPFFGRWVTVMLQKQQAFR